MPPLGDTIAVVTGATRGAGRGIAKALGAAGATVYVTGRSSRASGRTNDYPGTIEEAAEAVTSAGGLGVPVRCDHRSEEEVQALFARVASEQGRLDVLVNNAWGGHDLRIGVAYEPFWELSSRNWDAMFTGGVRAGILSSKYAAPLMIARGRGLIVNTTSYDDDNYCGTLYYDLAKNALNRMAFAMACDLRAHGVAAVALSPGWMRTELVLEAFATAEERWREVADLRDTETPTYLGRAVVALASDPRVMEKTGRTLRVADLAREYGFTDVDGSQPPPFRLPDAVPDPNRPRV